MLIRQRLANARHNLWMRLGRSESGLRMIERYGVMTGRDLHVTGPATELVIEGYPRSANTYAVAAFRVAQGDAVALAHHVHGPAQLLRAARCGIPCLLIVREPVAAVASLLQRNPSLKMRDALQNYLAFHRPLVASADRFVVAEFAQVVSDFNRVILAINAKYDRQFATLAEARAEAEILERIDRMDRRDRGKETVGELTVARPSHLRRERAAALGQRIAEHEPALTGEASRLYRTFAALSDATFPDAGRQA